MRVCVYGGECQTFFHRVPVLPSEKAREWKLPFSLGNSVSGGGGGTNSNRGSSSGDSSGSGSNIGGGNGRGVETKGSGGSRSGGSIIGSSTTIRSSSCSCSGGSSGGDAALADLGASVRLYILKRKCKSRKRVSFFLVLDKISTSSKEIQLTPSGARGARARPEQQRHRSQAGRAGTGRPC